MSDAWDGRPPGDAAKRDGWHWMQAGRNPEPAEWSHGRQLWRIAGSPLGYAPGDAAAAWRYIGPCLTPAEHAAAVKDAYKRGWNDREADFVAGAERTGMVVVEADAIAAAERRGMERAAGIADAAAKDWLGAPNWISDAIRAAAKEPAP